MAVLKNISAGEIISKVQKLLLYADISTKARLYNDKCTETEQKNQNQNLTNFTTDSFFGLLEIWDPSLLLYFAL